MSEHRRKPPQNGRRPDGPTSAGRGSVGSNASGGLPPRRTTARPQPGGAPGQTAAQPRMTRAEMRRAAQGKGGGGGNAGPGRGSRGAGKQPPNGPKPKRLIDYPRWGKSGVRRWLPSWKLVLSTFLVIFGGLTGVVGYAYASVSIPSANAASQLQGNVYYWDNQQVMATTGYNRQNVSLADVPQDIQHDFMAAEDETFETNSGVDPMSILRAVRNMATGGSVQSGSTITQQYVKNVYLNSQQTATRKLKEILIAVKIGNGGMSKDQVLEGYLNTNYYGRGAYGIEAAAEAYYGVHANQLTLSQGAFIAATVNQPSTFQNVDTDKTALSIATGRWQYVLSRMVVNNWMTQADEQAALAKGFPMPQIWKHNPGLTGQVGYLVDLATNYAETHSGGQLTDAMLARGGYKIYTTFNKADVDALSASVQKMESEHISTKLHGSADANVQVGAASINPANGEIKAIYGGAGMDKGYYIDNANTLLVPVGSTFKPIDLAAALTNGAVQTPNGPRNPITPDSKYNADDCLKIHKQDGTWLTDNSGNSACPEPDGLLHQANDDTLMPGYQTLRYAMENSINTPYVQLGEDVGYDNVEQMAMKVGLNESSLQTDTAGFYIGTSTPSAIRMADAYATFADQGMQHEPVSVKQVTYEGATQSWLPAETAKYAMSQQVANTVTNVLQGVIQKGTGTHALALGRNAAGKTGTTDDYKSAWFIGYTPQLSTAVMLYKEDPVKGQLETMKGVGGFAKVYGADMPTEVWTDYMSAALNGQPNAQFPTPQPFTQPGSNEPGMPAPSPTSQPSATATATSSPSSTASTNPSGQPSDTSSPSSSSTACSWTDVLAGTCNTSSPSGGPTTNPTPTGRHHGGGGTPSGPATAGTNNVPGG